MHSLGQDRSARHTSRRPPVVAPGGRARPSSARRRCTRSRGRCSTPASAARASSTWPASTSPATAATLPIDVGTAFQDPHRGQDRNARRTSWRPPPAAAPGTRPARYATQVHSPWWPSCSTPPAIAPASVHVAGHGRNIDLVDVRTLPRIHIAMPAPRWRQDQAHARPWPGPEHTAHQLANATCSSAWCTPGPVVPVHTEVPALRETANDAYDLL